MNSCEKFRNMICIYTDGELGERDKELLFEHIRICHECKVELDMMQKTRDCLKNMPVMPLPEGFSEAFRQNLTKDEAAESEKKVIPFYRRWHTYTTAAAVILFAFVLNSGLTDKNIILTQEAQPKENIIPQTELSAGTDNSAADNTVHTRSLQNMKADEQEPYLYSAQESLPQVAAEPQYNEAEDISLTDATEAMPKGTPESLPEAASETTQDYGIAAASEESHNMPQVRASGGGGGASGGGSSDIVYQSVYQARENVATVFVKSGDASLASALFDIIMYTPQEIESILSKNGITDFSIKTPIGEFEGYYVDVQITE